MIDRNLNHKNLVKLLGVSLDGNPIYIVTEFCGKVRECVQKLDLSIIIAIIISLSWCAHCDWSV